MTRPRSGQASLPGLWRIFRYFLPRLRRERGLVAGSFLALFAEVFLRLLEPWPLKFIFDRVIATSPGGGQSGIAAVDALNPLTLLTLSALGVVVITGLRSMASYFNTVGFALVGNRVLTAVRGDLFQHLQTLSLSFHSRARGGDLTIRVIGDVGLLKDVIVTAMLPMLGNTLILLGMLSLMLWLNWQLTLLGLVTVPLFWFATSRLSRRIQEVARAQRQREGALASTAAESIGAIKTVQALSLEKMFSQTFAG
ncbi:MAG TPA: ABC transporter ATP-binding protein, partial [Chloroflexota bacterium]|nr:ABC transporter ATP-binding protein [Chloroflexota bacterium]